MNPLIGLLALLGVAFCIQMAARLFLYIFFPKPKTRNPYIQMHQIKDKNDQNYDEYLKWLDKKGYGVPVPKIQTPEEKAVEDKFKKML